ncbi:MAG TPA: glycosyltransferase family 2 protein [Anaerolineales bacterium]|jgi:glycosyltransferase involved in cell wall biosynthesis
MEGHPDLTAIILTLNEEVHIQRCILSLQPVCRKIFVIDSFSSDGTVKIAADLGAEVLQHPFTNQAHQLQWGLDNLIIDTRWIMRVDADEYLETDLHEELAATLADIPDEIDGIFVKLKVVFEGQWIRHGGFYPLTLMRIWRNGRGRIEQRWMDEHILLPAGARTITLNGGWVDGNLKGMTFWVTKHNKYASREAAEMLNRKYHLLPPDVGLIHMTHAPAKGKRLIKERVYSRLPMGLRAALYFLYRYFLLLGFLDGRKGLVWHFMQGFWYRWLVDIKIMEIEERGRGNPTRIREILRDEHGITL